MTRDSLCAESFHGRTPINLARTYAVPTSPDAVNILACALLELVEATRATRRIVRKRGLIWNGSTPLGQRFFGFDFGWFAVGVLLDGPEATDAR